MPPGPPDKSGCLETTPYWSLPHTYTCGVWKACVCSLDLIVA
jgi:hypothetical protein